MTLRRTTLMSAVVLAACGGTLANLPPVEDAAPYRLVEGSTLTAECLACGARPVTVPIRGGFRLEPLEGDPLWTRYAVLDVSFAAAGSPETHGSTGQGQCAQGGGVALLQEMRLELTIDGQAGLTLENEPAPVQTGFPWIEIDLASTSNPGVGWSYRLHLVAAPWGRLRFSTAHDFHSSPTTGASAFHVSGGDLLAPAGWIVRTSQQLTARPGILPLAPDLGLDAAVGAARLDPAAPHELRFCIEQDVLSAPVPKSLPVSAPAQNDALEIAAKAGRVCFFAGLPKSNPIAPLDVNHVHYKGLVNSGSYSEKKSLLQARGEPKSDTPQRLAGTMKAPPLKNQNGSRANGLADSWVTPSASSAWQPFVRPRADGNHRVRRSWQRRGKT